MDQLLTSKKMFIFDLDNTLYDFYTTKDSIMETEEYKKKIVNMLETLKANNKIIAICTYNIIPMYTLSKRRPELLHYFNLGLGNIIYPTSALGFIYYREKSLMILEFAKNFNGILPSDIVLFDDQESNIEDVRNHGMTGILVDTKKGIFESFSQTNKK